MVIQINKINTYNYVMVIKEHLKKIKVTIMTTIIYIQDKAMLGVLFTFFGLGDGQCKLIVPSVL